MATDAVRLFDDWARTGRADRMGANHLPRGEQALRRLPLSAGQSCLDLGCGAGWATRWLAAGVQPGGEAVGVDLAPTMLDKARAEGGDGVRFVAASLVDLPFPDASFDHAFSMEALYYVDVDAALRELARVLRPGGHAVIAVDFYEENAASASWPTDLGIPMARLSTAGWADAHRRAGLTVLDTFLCPDPGGKPPTLAIHSRR